METKYSTKELCEILRVKAATFRAHKSKYLKELQENYHVREVKEGGKNYYYLTPKNTLANILKCNIGKLDINVIGIILKAILQGEIAPIQKEYARITGVGQSTISTTYIKFLKENNIILPPEKVKHTVADKSGKELYKYEQKVGSYVYYDTKPDGTVVRFIDKVQQQLHETYQRAWALEFATTITPMQNLGASKEQIGSVMGNIDRRIWREINLALQLHKCNRVMKPRVNPDIEQQLKEYFGL
ncbi:winged helix-turn-helix domain-containing protein [Bacillus nitratireducens]|uniref:winged helix-turn-helix domain-containing protein n=1 Tax=Bacillus nitratireducens TaxID=2026193 RepID=UPI00089B0D5A|nr:winged helix-turn-helix domain-containing protein [Bacillus nitratireducens]SEA91406.1 hypothetical protein SAMN04488146_104414 [Bacillus nitratireducens]